MADIEGFIARWTANEGGQERANYALFLSELADVLGVARPEPANASTENNDYVFERAVKEPNGDGSFNHRRIDLYKRGCFVLEAKQSRLKAGSAKAMAPTTADLAGEGKVRGKRGADRSWDALMFDAKAQAVNYARCLPPAHGWPPFVLVCDVGHVVEVFADFTGQGKNYAQFPDRQGFRIYLEDLRRDEIRARLRAIWTDPHALDPSKKAARVTREIAERLAAVSKASEKHAWPTEEVAMFLMRCLFTMFAEDVELLPKDSFRDVLRKCEADPSKFPHLVGQMWEAMDTGGFAHAIEAKVKRFNGEFFKRRTVLPLDAQEIGELRAAAEADWREVEPAIFGTLLEQALDPTDRKRLGAHYTPRAHVERLVVATIVEPLRDEWNATLATAERQRSEGREKEARATLQAFHDKLCRTRVLDPACGTGNFLYVALELLKRLEGEVLEALSAIGGQESFSALEGHTVDPHQFLGLELNPRAAAIAELVLWIGYLQWHFRTKGAAPSEPILKAFKNIRQMDAVLTWDGYPLPKVVDGREVYPNPRRPEWPTAEYIVGNPPFVSNREMRDLLGDGYVDALKIAYPMFNQAADFVLFFWICALQGGVDLRRVGFVSTTRLRMLQNNIVFENALAGKWGVIFAIPDHSWPTTADAAIRVCFATVSRVVNDCSIVFAPDHEMVSGKGNRFEDYVTMKVERINSDLTIGVNYKSIPEILSNKSMCHSGVKPYARTLHIKKSLRDSLFDNLGVAEIFCPMIYNGHDIGQGWRGYYVLDLNQFSESQLRTKLPHVYQYVAEHTKEERSGERNKRLVRDYWKFEANRNDMRVGLSGLVRYIATVENSPHRYFVFIDGNIIPDQKVRVVISDDSYFLGILSSRWHDIYAEKIGGRTGKANTPVYNTRCFSTFPFPATDDLRKQRIRGIAEELDAHRKRVLAEHPHLTLTGLYNVLERLRAGVLPADLEPSERRIFDDGLVLILKELHDRLDVAVADAYGWPADLSDEEILARLVALNKERAREEARGLVRWLRPEYQIPKFGSAKEKAEQLEATLVTTDATAAKPAYPATDAEQTAVVMAALMDTPAGLDAAGIAARFRKGRGIEAKIAAVLAALHRMGLAWSDDGRTWRLRRAA